MTDKKVKHSVDKESTGGLKIALGIVALIVGIFVIAVGVPFLIGVSGIEDTRAIEGDGAAYDPIAAYDTVLAYAGENAQLTRIEAFYVRSDGTMDLYAEYFPRVSYEFYLLAGAEAGNDIPLGAPNSSANAEQLYQKVEIDVWHPNQLRTVTSSGNSYTYTHLGMAREIDEPSPNKPAESVAAPICSFADLWAIAIAEADAPANAVAIIEYDTDGYAFRINDTNVRLEFDMDCELD